MFGRATITLGIGPHSSLIYFIAIVVATRFVPSVSSRVIAECIVIMGLIEHIFCCHDICFAPKVL